MCPDAHRQTHNIRLRKASDGGSPQDGTPPGVGTLPLAFHLHPPQQSHGSRHPAFRVTGENKRNMESAVPIHSSSCSAAPPPPLSTARPLGPSPSPLSTPGYSQPPTVAARRRQWLWTGVGSDVGASFVNSNAESALVVLSCLRRSNRYLWSWKIS